MHYNCEWNRNEIIQLQIILIIIYTRVKYNCEIFICNRGEEETYSANICSGNAMNSAAPQQRQAHTLADGVLDLEPHQCPGTPGKGLTKRAMFGTKIKSGTVQAKTVHRTHSHTRPNYSKMLAGMKSVQSRGQ